ALVRATAERQRLGDALIAMGAATATDVLKALALQQELPFLSAEELPSTPPALRNLSPKYLRQYVACPVAVDGAVVTVATADPTNTLLLDDLQQSLGLTIKLCVAPAPAILEAIERAYGANTALQKIVEGMGPARANHEGEPDEDISLLRDMAFEAPVVRLVNLLIEGALAAEASDIHIEPFEDSLRVRYRIDGLLYDQESPPRRLQAALTSRIKIMAEMNIAERRLPQDGRIRVTAPGSRRVDIRVSTVPTIHGESIVMRLLDRSSVFLPFDRLGFAPAAARAFERLIHQPHGIVLVTGPTGSGKTTTLYAALDKINRPDLKIITVEDPVEYQLKGINQIPVRPKIGLSFASGLRHIVRQDPDVIMVGEIRDLETAEIAIQAALTGHLVFSTLHTNDAPGAVTRLQDMGCEPYLVSSVLSGVLAQRLVRRICQACRALDHPDPASLLALGVTDVTGVELFHGKGCDDCRGTGYRGRTGIYELFRITEEARSLVVRKAPAGEIRRHAVAQGMLTLREDAWAKACAGLTTVEEILRVTQEDT
ncbi:MAG TPA: type II secretion system ATPase GspE, partial [Candidatus Dormibacteraeota bacterium]|nr:type II secretion system ATPase GspE [Candidatus Dormibacteraeota bacterium]